MINCIVEESIFYMFNRNRVLGFYDWVEFYFLFDNNYRKRCFKQYVNVSNEIINLIKDG